MHSYNVCLPFGTNTKLVFCFFIIFLVLPPFPRLLLVLGIHLLFHHKIPSSGSPSLAAYQDSFYTCPRSDYYHVPYDGMDGKRVAARTRIGLLMTGSLHSLIITLNLNFRQYPAVRSNYPFKQERFKSIQ